MRISIPNIFPTLSYLFLLTAGTIMGVAFLETMGEDGIGITIFFVIMVLLFLGAIIMISIRMKIVLVSKSELRVVYPFKLKILRFKIDHPTSCIVDVLDMPKFGVYQKVTIKSGQAYISFSDIEFSNFNHLIEHLPINKDELWTARVQVAKFNRVINLILIPIISFFLIMAIDQLISGATHPIPKVIFMISAFILYRLISRLFLYFRWTKRVKKL